MKSHDVYALKNLLLVISGWTELGRPDKVLQAVKDMDSILGRDVQSPWKIGRQVFALHDGHVLTLEADGRETPVRMALESPVGVEVMMLSCSVARRVAELLLVYCDQAELAREK